MMLEILNLLRGNWSLSSGMWCHTYYMPTVTHQLYTDFRERIVYIQTDGLAILIKCLNKNNNKDYCVSLGTSHPSKISEDTR